VTKPVHRATPHRSALVGVEAFTLVSARAFPRHAHDQFGIGVLLDGAQRSWSGIGQVEAFAGDTIMVNPGEVHDGLPVRESGRCWRMLYLDPGLVSRELGEGALRGEIARPTVRDPVLAGLFTGLFAKLTAQAPEPLAIEGSLLLCLDRVRRHWSTPARSAGSRPAIGRAKQCIDDDPAAGLSLAELAATAGVSRFQLLRGFAREFGLTPHAYVMQERVRLARRLLRAGQSIAEAALDSGFADQSHMTRAFVRQLGVTPGRYQAATLA
jgi:AraC-like DNA-binding protein